jgi:Kef-type K+ transport system membrane component KefB
MKTLMVVLAGLMISSSVVFAEEEVQKNAEVSVVHDVHAEDAGHHDDGHAELLQFAMVLLFASGMLLLGRGGALVERWGLPSVLGELIAGIILYNASLLCGWDAIEQLRDGQLLKMFAFVGVILLLFKSGLEEDLHHMAKVGLLAAVVAIVGVVLPFAGGYAASKYMLFSDQLEVVHVFIGATLVATSVGITAKIFSDLNYTGPTKSLVIGAAVIDDVIGLIILAVVGVMADGGEVTGMMVGKTAGGAMLFLVGAIVVGRLSAPVIGRVLSSVHTGVGMKQAMALGFCALFSFAAVTLAGLEPIIGAFAAGLVLTPVDFKNFDLSHQVGRMDRWMTKLEPSQVELRSEMQKIKHEKEHSHVESLVEGIARFFVPIFFVHTGMSVNLSVFMNPQTVLIALVFAVIAIVGKLACGLVVGKKANGPITGWSMVARGEVGLVFANIGLAKGVFTSDIFAVAVVIVVITTFIPPVILPRLIRKEQEANA